MTARLIEFTSDDRENDRVVRWCSTVFRPSSDRDACSASFSFLVVDHTFAFDDRQYPIAAAYAHSFQRAVWPLHFDLIDLSCRTQSEMQPEIILRGVAPSADNVLSLAELAGSYVSYRSDRVTRTL